MQKFYALTLAVATVFTASAGVNTLKQNPVKIADRISSVRTISAPLKNVTKKAASTTFSASTSMAQPRIGMMKEDGKTQEIAGNYILTIDDVYFEQTSQGTIRSTAKIVDNGNSTITMTSDMFIEPVTAAYDAATGNITFSAAELGQMTFSFGSYYVKFEPGIWSSTTGTIDVVDYTVTFNANTGMISFPADHNFGWHAYSDAEYLKSAGYVELYDVLSLEKDNTEPFYDGEVAGQYTAAVNDVYFQSSTGQQITGDAEITNNQDGTIIIDSSLFPMPVQAAYDAETFTITFSAYDLGAIPMQDGSTYYGRFEPGYWDYTAKDIVVADFTVTYDPSTGKIIFPDDHNFGWPVYSDATYTTMEGYMDLFDVVSLVKKQSYKPGDDQEKVGMWKDAGKATFVDAWVTALLEINYEFVDPASFAFEVPLQQSVQNPNVYRLWAPYHQPDFVYADANQSEYQGQIVFDITDPEHVFFKPGIPAGMLLNNGELYAYDLLGWQIWSMGDQFVDAYLPLIYEFMTENNQPFSTFKNGVVTVEQSIFDFAPACTHSYSWNNVKTLVSTITFHIGGSVEMVEVNDAPVEYFNMQGIRVEKPEAGQILIKRQGKETSKVVVR